MNPRRALLREFDGVLGDLSDHVAMRRGRVAVAALPSLAAGWLPRVFAGFRAAWPGVELALYDALSEQCVEMVKSGKADFALASTQVNEPELSAEPYCSDRFYLVCPRAHPLARKKTVSVDDVAAWPFIQLSRASSARQHLDAAIFPRQMQTVLEVEHLATVAGMVEAGVGVSLVPGLTLFHFERDTLAIRPLSSRGAPPLRRAVYLVTRRDRSLSVAAQALVEAVRAQRPAERRAAG